MSYLVLARKWRPKSFADTVGQEHVLRALSNALDSERLHHAYLFAGTRGVGKTTIARIFAKALNCEKGISSTPCGSCSACKEIDEGRFVDLIEVDAASRTKVDDTRDLLDNVQYAPARGRFKVYLIDEVHMLSKSSFNALLKTLEEPPPHVKFLLATTDPQKLPVTVLSRCLQFNLKRLTPKLIRDRLAYICDQEEVSADSGALAMIARAADGSVRDALSLLDQAIAYCGGDVIETSVATMLGTIDRQHVSRFLKLLSDSDAAGLIAAIAAIDEHFPDYGRLLDDIARMLQRIAVFQMVGAVDSDEDGDDTEVEDFSSRLSPEDVQLYYQTAILGRRDLRLAPDPRSGAEMTLLRMLAFQPPSAAGEHAGSKRARPTSSTSEPTQSKSTQVVPPKPVQSHGAAPTAWKDPDWAKLIGVLNFNGANKMLAGNCAFIRRENNIIFLALDLRSEAMLTKPREKAIAAALSEHFGEQLKVQITLEECAVETPLQIEARIEDQKLQQAREKLEADPNVKTLQDMFGAELKSDSIEVVNDSQ